MNNQFLSPELSFVLKDMGFDNPCFGYYTHNDKLSRYGSSEVGVDFLFCTHKDIYHSYCLAPTYQQAIEFLAPKLDGNSEYRIIIQKKSGTYLMQYMPDGSFLWENYSDGTNEDCVNKIIKIISNFHK